MLPSRLAPPLSLAFVIGLAGSSLSRQEPTLPERPLAPGQIPPPDLPPPADGGPLAYVHTTDEAIKLFQGRVDRNPRDHVSCRILGEFHERKAEESGDLAGYERAEAALRRCLEIAPDYDKARALARNPVFSPHAEDARKALANLGKELLESK